MDVRSSVRCVVLSLTAGVSAQQAVQWKVSDGGNGHWYAYLSTPKQWTEAKPYAESLGGHLVTVQSAAEASFVRTLGGDTCWIGLFQDRAAPGYSEPSGGWRWVTGEPLDFTFWRVNTNGQSNEPNNLGGNEDFVHLDANATTWNDLTDGPYPFAVEWDADCNVDGIVDFGQVRNGSLADVDLDNVPDCCEQSIPCEYRPAEWKPSAGGNGHWYQLRFADPCISWESAQAEAESVGGHLATLTSPAENEFVFALADATAAYGGSPVVGPWIGGRRVDGAWSWITAEAWSFTNWLPPNPDGPGTWLEDRTCLTSTEGKWNDFNASGSQPGIQMRTYVVEWSADCDRDGTVDYGQILAGEIADEDHDFVPDPCEASPDLEFRLSGSGISGFIGEEWFEGATWTLRGRARSELLISRFLYPEDPEPYFRYHLVDPIIEIDDGTTTWQAVLLERGIGPWAITSVILYDYPEGGPVPAIHSVRVTEESPNDPEMAMAFAIGGPADLHRDMSTPGSWSGWSAACTGCNWLTSLGPLVLKSSDGDGEFFVVRIPGSPDLDGNGVVAAEDLAMVLFAWGASGPKAGPADIDRNGVVEGPDLSAVLAAWGASP
jgi:hypothetical protein